MAEKDTGAPGGGAAPRLVDARQAPGTAAPRRQSAGLEEAGRRQAGKEVKT